MFVKVGGTIINTDNVVEVLYSEGNLEYWDDEEKVTVPATNARAEIRTNAPYYEEVGYENLTPAPSYHAIVLYGWLAEEFIGALPIYEPVREE